MPSSWVVPLALLLGLALVVLSFARGVRRVPPDERLVRVRMGRFDERSLCGPGWVFLVPVIDRGVRVRLTPQRFVLEAVPADTPDGSGALVDLEIGFRVVDPVAFVTHILPLPAGLRVLSRAALRKALEDAAPGAALFPGDVEARVAPLLEGRLSTGGARDISIKVARVRSGSVEDADEVEFQAFLRQEGIKLPRQHQRHSKPRDIDRR